MSAADRSLMFIVTTFGLRARAYGCVKITCDVGGRVDESQVRKSSNIAIKVFAVEADGAAPSVVVGVCSRFAAWFKPATNGLKVRRNF